MHLRRTSLKKGLRLQVDFVGVLGISKLLGATFFFASFREST